MRNVELQVMRPWVSKEVTKLVGFDDEVLIEYIMSLLEDKDNPVSLTLRTPCGRLSMHFLRSQTLG